MHTTVNTHPNMCILVTQVNQPLLVVVVVVALLDCIAAKFLLFSCICIAMLFIVPVPMYACACVSLWQPALLSLRSAIILANNIFPRLL